MYVKGDLGKKKKKNRERERRKGAYIVCPI
jgi:hypothetical protein